jgi:arsenate reductase
MRGETMPMKRKVLFICVQNSARSQMAEELLKKMAGDTFEIESAGLEPSTINPLTIEVMKEEGVDLSTKGTKDAFEFFKEGRQYDYVIIVCGKAGEEKCPTYPGARERLHWPFDDPAKAGGSHEEKLQAFREVREGIRKKLESFIDVFAGN